MLAQAPGGHPPEQPKTGKHHRPHAGQQQEIAGDAPGRTGRRLIDQLIHFIDREAGTQTPDVDEVFVEIEFGLDLVDACTDGPQ
ncbi:hypothetical protein D3C78_782910 [compost metagenome]